MHNIYTGVGDSLRNLSTSNKGMFLGTSHLEYPIQSLLTLELVHYCFLRNSEMIVGNDKHMGYVTDFDSYFDKIGAVRIESGYNIKYSRETDAVWLIGACTLGYFYADYVNEIVHIKLYSGDREEYERFTNGFSPLIKNDKKKTGHVKILCQDRDMYLHDLGSFHNEFFPENYNADTVDKFYSTLANITSSAPHGRLIILHGEAGTGKSFWIRSLISQVDADFVYIPQSLISGITNPSLFSTLLNERSNKPIILVLEDSDGSIIQRQTDNNSDVANLLNITDGILGSLVNLHVLATVNVKKTIIDPAFMRTGRLHAYIEFNRLKADQGRAILHRLCPEKDFLLEKDEYTLSEIYGMARECGWVPEQSSISSRSYNYDYPALFRGI